MIRQIFNGIIIDEENNIAFSGEQIEGLPGTKAEILKAIQEGKAGEVKRIGSIWNPNELGCRINLRREYAKPYIWDEYSKSYILDRSSKSK